jgi:hypothetical protein
MCFYCYLLFVASSRKPRRSSLSSDDASVETASTKTSKKLQKLTSGEERTQIIMRTLEEGRRDSDTESDEGGISLAGQSKGEYRALKDSGDITFLPHKHI